MLRLLAYPGRLPVDTRAVKQQSTGTPCPESGNVQQCFGKLVQRTSLL